MPYHGKVVSDEEVAEPLGPVLQFFQQVDNLGLNGNIQGGDGLVADNEVGVSGHGARHADTLALATGELMGETVGHGGVKADDAE